MLNISTKHISQSLIEELSHAFEMVKQFGSIELYVQGGRVTQITARTIKKLENGGVRNPKSNSSGMARKR